jgi:DNA-binding transcriptional MocR family regulator
MQAPFFSWMESAAIAWSPGHYAERIVIFAFAASSRQPESYSARRRDHFTVIDFQFNYPLLGKEAALIAAALRKHSADPIAPQPETTFAGSAKHRDVAASNLSRKDFTVPASRVFLCAGGHAAIAIALASASLDGAAIAVDELTYPHFRAMAADRGIKLIACAGDEEGMLPDALAEAARTHGVRAVYLMPTVHNPLGTVMPPSRRLALANIIRQHALSLIEDDAYRFLEPDAPAPIAFLVPELSFYIFSFSKPISPDLRVAYLLIPEGLSANAEALIAQLNSGTSHLFGEVLTSLILDGTVSRLIAEKQALGHERQALISRSLTGLNIHAHRNAFHCWIEVPECTDASTFCAACESKGVMVASGARYGNGGPAALRHIRLAVGNERNLDRIIEGLAAVKLVASSAPSKGSPA